MNRRLSARGGRAGSASCVCVLALALLSTAVACGDRDDGDAASRTSAFDLPQARLRVRTETVRRERLGNLGRVTGTARAFNRAIVTAETQGRVVERVVDAGASVEEGGLILRLESSRMELEVRRTEAALQAARTVLAHAQREYDRGQQLLAQNAISTQHHDDLRHAVERAKDEIALATVARDTAKRDLGDTRIRAPFAGTVDSLAVNIGDFVAPGTPVATLVDLSRVRIYGGVTARETLYLEPGALARVTFADLGGAVFEATLQTVGRVAGRGDGTYEIELWLDTADVPMRDGLVAQIELPDSLEEPTLLVPRAAVLRRAGQPEVFVISMEDAVPVARARRLRTGRSQGDSIEVLEGLVEGDRVIWDGHFALEDGSVVVVEGGTPVVASAVGSSE